MPELSARSAVTVGACVDRAGVGGLEMMLRSLVSSQRVDTRLDVHVLHHGIPQRTRERLSAVIQGAAIGKVAWTAFEPERFFKGRPVFGLMAYARIFLPEVTDAERLLYLDTDLLVYRSLADVADISMEQSVAAVQDKTFGRSNCKEFFARVGANPDTPYFNTGVLIIDSVRWTAERTRFHLLELAARANWDLRTGDQTLLNYYFNGRFTRLPVDWNRLAYAGAAPLSELDEQTKIIHFVGRPKPWECGGWINRQYPLWRRLADQRALLPQAPEMKCWPDTVRRLVRYGPSYLKCAARRLETA
jgi:lipopolysaccharide biosynthesis glycosyltransferase